MNREGPKLGSLKKQVLSSNITTEDLVSSQKKNLVWSLHKETQQSSQYKVSTLYILDSSLCKTNTNLF